MNYGRVLSENSKYYLKGNIDERGEEVFLYVDTGGNVVVGSGEKISVFECSLRDPNDPSSGWYFKGPDDKYIASSGNGVDMGPEYDWKCIVVSQTVTGGVVYDILTSLSSGKPGFLSLDELSPGSVLSVAASGGTPKQKWKFILVDVPDPE